ncbi:gamma-glutamylcyclotransferase family protein [Streptomyces sp. NPDC021080]|uniref:gamma-glutamylcyclotransferase family protein n=1 Tax=Streptomyces sp. NPDC021080 TaxID=3365110 RepID=UPI00378D6C8E
MHAEFFGDLRDRPARLDHDAYSTLTKLRHVRPLLGPHEPQLPLQSRTPRYEGRDIGRVPERQPTTTLGWRAAALEGRVYPGLVSAPGAEARGILLTGVSEREWRVLDAFEDDRYYLQRIDVTCRFAAWVYVWPGGEAQVEDWDAEGFQERHLQAYAERCARIASDLVAKLSTEAQNATC